jgi:hypothetical protein
MYESCHCLPELEYLLTESSYVTNLGPSSASSLMATASASHAGPLSTFLSQHLMRRTSVRVTMPVCELNLHFVAKVIHPRSLMTNYVQSRGLQLFILEFHLPYFTLRASHTPIEDLRRTSDNQSLRKSTDVSFLRNSFGNQDPKSRRTWLCEAHISVSLTGFDNWTWTVYGFADTYFGGSGDELDEDSDDYTTDSPFERDPLTRRELLSCHSPSDPRLYFLAVLQIRLCHVAKEWQNVVDMVSCNVEQRVSQQLCLRFC